MQNMSKGMATRFHIETPGLPCIFRKIGPRSSCSIARPSSENATFVSLPLNALMLKPDFVLNLPIGDCLTIAFAFAFALLFSYEGSGVISGVAIDFIVPSALKTNCGRFFKCMPWV